MAFRFHEWKVYQDARDLRLHIKQEVLPRIAKEDQYNLGDQLRRAATSVVLNIAEGSFRASDKDFARFLNQANASCSEIAACLDCCRDDGYIDSASHFNLQEKAENIAKQLSGFSKTLLSNPN